MGSNVNGVSSTAFQSIPIIDILPLFGQDQQEKLGVARQLHEACRNVGFFYVKNHGLESGLLGDVLTGARRWFALSLGRGHSCKQEEEKKKISLSAATHFRGYQPLGVNVTKHDKGFSRDWHEGIDFYREGKAGSKEHSAVHGANLWPSQIPEFEAELRQYFEACLRVGQILMQGIALGLGLQEDYFERPGSGGTTADTSFWVARVLHYPPLSQGSSHQADQAALAAQGGEAERSLQLSCGEHSDYGLLTLVNQQEDLTALQVKNQAGKWIDAKPIPGTLVCNIGDMLKIYTDGLYTPTVHRVINSDPTISRISIPFFYECAFDTEVAPIAQLANGSRGTMHRPIKYGTHLLSKVLNNFDFDEARKAVTA